MSGLGSDHKLEKSAIGKSTIKQKHAAKINGTFLTINSLDEQFSQCNTVQNNVY